ncbi:MAG: isoaspartyl peptidase/L-asparaginase [Pseudonocardiaceae bacterium]
MTVLRDGGSALDAVVAAVVVLEDDEQFNAGRGAVLTAGGGVEHGAAVADGVTRRAGAVTCVSGVRNPVRAARAVMERTPHVLLSAAVYELGR